MSNLFLDVLDGSIDVKKANAACNVANTMLKGIQIKYQLEGPDDHAKDRSKIINFLSETDEPVKPFLIARETGVSADSILDVLDHPAFIKTGDGIRLASI